MATRTDDRTFAALIGSAVTWLFAGALWEIATIEGAWLLQDVALIVFAAAVISTGASLVALGVLAVRRLR